MTFADNPYAGADAEMFDPERFARGIAQALWRCLRSESEHGGTHAAYILHPNIPESLAEQPSQTRYSIDDGQTDLTSGLWLVGRGVGRAHRLEAADTYDGLFAQVEEAGLGAEPAVTFRHSASGPILRYFPNGLADPDNRHPMEFDPDELDLAYILELVDRVHRGTLITPSEHSGGARLWEDASRHHPVRAVEREIQAYVRCGIGPALPLCLINIEQPTIAAGRLDIEIESVPDSAGQLKRYAILELKVLRSFGSTGIPTTATDTEGWVQGGIIQASSYRTQRRALESALCCFDMRTNAGNTACLDKFESTALSLDVVVRSWPLYPTSEAFRAATVAV